MMSKNTFLDYLDLYKGLKEREAKIKRLIIKNLEFEEYEEALTNFKKLKTITGKINLIEKMEMKYKY